MKPIQLRLKRKTNILKYLPHFYTAEWEINTGTNILTLSDPDNKIININLTELKTSRSKVLKLHLDGKWRM